MILKKKRIIIICLLSVFLLPNAYALEQRTPAEKNAGETKPGINPGSFVVSLFRKYVSPVDSNRCPSYPSCSSYSVNAFKKHGFIKGWLMTVDRLIHEGSEEKNTSPSIKVDGVEKIYDPVENNDFWWHKKQKKSRP